MSKVLIVDDSDPAILYTGRGWTTGTSVSANSNEYNLTFHYSDVAGDELSYTFFGTGIKVFGTLDRPDANGSPSASFSIDRSPPTAFNASETVILDNTAVVTSHMVLYETSGLTKDSHTLSIITRTPTNPAARLYVDFFTVTAGSDVVTGSVILDDRDISIIYTAAWNGGGNGVVDEYMHSTTLAPHVGNGPATFHFNGTSVTIFGTTMGTTGPSTTAVIGFSLDGIPKGNFTGPTQSPSIKNTPVFHARELSNDQEHTIEISSLSNNRFFLDYIVYTTSNSAPPDNGNSGLQEGGRTTNVGVIAGAVVAAVVVFLALVGIIFMLWRRRKARRNRHDNDVPLGVPRSTAPERVFTSRDNADTRSIRSVRSTSGSINRIGTLQTGLASPSGILRSGEPSSSVANPLRVRISDTVPTSPVSMSSSTGAALSDS